MLTYDIVPMRFKQKKKKENNKKLYCTFCTKKIKLIVYILIKTTVARKKNNICSQAFLEAA